MRVLRRHRKHVANPQPVKLVRQVLPRHVYPILFTASDTGLPNLNSICARSRSAPVISARPSTRKMMCAAFSNATCACFRIWLGIYSESLTTMPPVSITSNCRPS